MAEYRNLLLNNIDAYRPLLYMYEYMAYHRPNFKKGQI